MKKKLNACYCRRQWPKKMLRVMKIGFFLLVLGLTSVHATTFSQQKVNLNVKNVTLLHVLDLLQEQSEFSFLFSSEDVKNVTNLSVKAKNEDLFEALNTVKKHLKDNGLFLLDCFNPNIQYIVENEREQHVMAEYTTNDGRSVLIRQSMHYESASQINRIKWQYFIDGAFHSVQNMDMRLFFPQELNSYLHQAGFNVVHKFGDFTECEFNDNSEKQIYILELKK